MDKSIPAKVNDLWNNPFYRDVVAAIESVKPMQVRYDPKTNNIEEVKFSSAQSQLHELIVRVLKPKPTGETF